MDGCVAGTACRGDDFVFYNETNVFSGTAPNDSSGNVSEQGPIRQADAQCALFRFVFYGIVCFVLCLAGFVGNIISFVVFRRDKSSPAASFILQVSSNFRYRHLRFFYGMILLDKTKIRPRMKHE